MALRHYKGGLPTAPAPTAWKCPSCLAVNMGPLEAGCVQCGAGADGAHKGQAPVESPGAAVPAPPQSQARPLSQARGAEPPSRVDVPSGAAEAWEAWVEQRAGSEVNWGLVRGAFMAGVAWVQGQQQEVAPELPQAPDLYLYLVNRETMAEDGLQGMANDATRNTVLAALAFYRDNALSYGSVPGQLSAQQVTELIDRLTPAAEGPEGL